MLNKNMKSKMSVKVATALVVALMVAGCGASNATVETESATVVASSEASIDVSEVTAVITLSDNGSVVAGNGASVEENDIVITSGGTFSFTGTLTEGRIKVEAEGQDVTIILNGVTISNSEKDAIYVEYANSATIYVMEGTENVLTSGTTATYEEAKAAVDEANKSENTTEMNSTDATENESESTDVSESIENSNVESDAASDSTSTEETDEGFNNSQKATVMAKCSLTIAGSGALTVNGYINNGIQSKEALTISDVNLTLTSANDGIKSGTELNILSGTFDIDSYGDAIQSDGTLNISDGYFDIFTGNGSASAEKKTEFGPGGGGMRNPNFNKESGEQMQTDGNMQPGGDMQADGNMQPGRNMQADGNMQPTQGENSESGEAPQMPDGNFAPFDDMGDSTDSDSNSVSQKGIKAAGIIVIDGGTFTIDSVDDAVHGSSDVTINGGTFNITTGDDGVHSDTNLEINGGSITITDSYEGIEAGVITVNGGDVNVTSSDDGFNASTTLTDPEIVINGGNVYVNADGDGIDSNKNITVNGGTVYVDGPSEDMNSAIDIGSENQGIFVVNGGTVTAVGSSGMLENADETSTQQTITYVFDETLEAGTTITVSNTSGEEVASFTLVKSAKAVTYSSADLVSGETYTFTAADQTGEITADTINATNNTRGSGFGGGFGGGMGGGPGQRMNQEQQGEAHAAPQDSTGN